HTYYDSAGTITRQTVDTTTIISDTLIGGEQWYTSNGTGFGALRSDGVWAYTQSGYKMRLLHYPAPLHDRDPQAQAPWRDPNQGNAVTDTLYTYTEITSLDTSITVPAGTFHCVKFTHSERLGKGGIPSNHPTTFNFECYAPEVGQVESTAYFVTQGGRTYRGIRHELVSKLLK
ncbi:MAG: hypothetical protein ABI876_13150, partial [Bacteroidota bacterium]